MRLIVPVVARTVSAGISLAVVGVAGPVVAVVVGVLGGCAAHSECNARSCCGWKSESVSEMWKNVVGLGMSVLDLAVVLGLWDGGIEQYLSFRIRGHHV